MTQTLEVVITDEDVDKLVDDEDLWAVLVWNDDVNTFAHVIKALVEILNHSLARAEQLTDHRQGGGGGPPQGRGHGDRAAFPRTRDPGDHGALSR